MCPWLMIRVIDLSVTRRLPFILSSATEMKCGSVIFLFASVRGKLVL